MLRDTIVNSQQLAQKTDGVLAFYDISRSKWQSVSRHVVTFGISQPNFSASRWMSCIDGIKSNQSGYRVPRNATITSLTIQTSKSSTATFRLRRNGVGTDLYSASLITEEGKTFNPLDVDLFGDDWVQIFITDVGTSGNPVVTLELAWRY